MLYYIGKTLTVREINLESNFFSIHESDIYDYNYWCFSVEMLDDFEIELDELTEIENDIITFAKVNPDSNAIIPSKEDEDAGYDIYANFEGKCFMIEPHETRMVPTGIASAIPIKYYMQLFERGSTGTKGMGQRCGVIDSGYRGEWFAPITNHNVHPLLITKETDEDTLAILRDDFIVYPYHKAICQAIAIEVPELTVKEVSYEELLKIESKRKTGMMGSSGK